jgi:hypothetical protein
VPLLSSDPPAWNWCSRSRWAGNNGVALAKTSGPVRRTRRTSFVPRDGAGEGVEVELPTVGAGDATADDGASVSVSGEGAEAEGEGRYLRAPRRDCPASSIGVSPRVASPQAVPR